MPNVSYCVNENEVHYNPYVPETRVVAKYNVTSTSSPTVLRTNYEQNIFKSMEIDGVMLDELVTEYTFGTTGVHTVKYELYNETKLGNQAPVFNSSNLVECIISDSVTSISDAAFVNCVGLISIVIPNSVTSIGGSAFGGCSGLTSCTIGSGVTSIGGYAFNDCTSLTSITVNAATPPTLGDSVFLGTNYCPIYVPSGSVDTYKAANRWSSIASRIQAIP